jgi:uncharacterized protein (TIGR03790 family)
MSAVLGLLLAAAPTPALAPKDVYLVINKNVLVSREIAEHYCSMRDVPESHIIALELPFTEDISRRDYDEKLAGPLRERLKDKKDKVKVLLTIYGVPLRVGGAEPSKEEKQELEKIQKEIAPVEKEKLDLEADIKKLESIAKSVPQGPAAKELTLRRAELDKVAQRLRSFDQRRRWLSHAESHAAVDSELALLWHSGFDLRRWQMNLLYFQVPDEFRKDVPPVVMTCRIDGPSPGLLKRLIDTSVAVERKGLKGKVYVDARGVDYNPKGDNGHGYGGYDESMREMARLLKDEGKLPVVLDNKNELFAPGSCGDCALYCGWYSHAKYIDCCRFVPGAVAWHLASSEATTLREPKSTVWCPNLLQAGAVATLGPVSEPYTIGFPKPAEFFGFLATGEYTLVECYWKTALFTSWMTTLVGDPLYNPFKHDPRLKPDQVKPSPKGVIFRATKHKRG